MDAPLRRLLLCAPLAAALASGGGCGLMAGQSDDARANSRQRDTERAAVDRLDNIAAEPPLTVARTSAAETVRGQSPSGPLPAAPLPASALPPAAPAASVKPPAPVVPLTGRPDVVPVEARAASDVKTRVKSVATVGPEGAIVTEDEVLMNVRQRAREFVALEGGERAAKEREVYRDELRKLIERELILSEFLTKVRKNKPQVLDEVWAQAGLMADSQVREIKAAFGLKTDAEFTDALTQQGLPYKAFRRQLERQSVVSLFMNSVVKDKAKTVGLVQVREYYDRHPAEFAVDDKVKWQHLFVSTSRFASAAEAKKCAEDLQKQAAGGADFAALVTKHGHGDSPLRNGDGIGDRRGAVKPAEVEATLFATPAGQVSGVIAGENGFHVVRVVERQQAGLRPLDEKVQVEVRNKLVEKVTRADKEKVVADLRRRITVTIQDEEPPKK